MKKEFPFDGIPAILDWRCKMRDKLWLVVNEAADGSVGVQAFTEDPKESFDNMNGKPSDEPSRVSLLGMDFEAGNVDAWSKELPVKVKAANQRPDAYRLGHGPVCFDEEDTGGGQG